MYSLSMAAIFAALLPVSASAASVTLYDQDYEAPAAYLNRARITTSPAK